MREFSSTEKPLLKLKCKTMIELVVNALVRSEKFHKIIAVSSYNAPMTNAYLRANMSQHVDIIIAEGTSYSQDIYTVLNTLRPATVFVVTADLPMLEFKDVEKIISQSRHEDACTSVVSAKQFVTSIGITPSVVVRVNSRQYCHTGISVIDSNKVNSTVGLPERYLIMNRIGVSVNVNTRSDFEAAKMMMC